MISRRDRGEEKKRVWEGGGDGGRERKMNIRIWQRERMTERESVLDRDKLRKKWRDRAEK